MATGAAIASTAVGAVGAKKAGDRADDALASQNDMVALMQRYSDEAITTGEDALAFSQGLVDDWEATFGGIQDNLSQYYSNLDPAKYAQEYKTNLNENIDKQVTQMNDTMSASGLQTAGMKQQTAKEAAFAKATGGAQADLMAEDKVNSMKQGFVNSGAGQQSAANSSTFNAYGNLSGSQMQAGANVGGVGANVAGDQAQMHADDTAGYMKTGLEGAATIGGMADKGKWFV